MLLEIIHQGYVPYTRIDTDAEGAMAESRRGFTLVELLVVIGIIAVLIAILMPALQRARQAALQTVCLSNIRQCALGFQEYATDYNGHIPNLVIYGTGGGFYNWPCFLSYGYNAGASPTAPTGAFVKYVDPHVTLCPATIHYAEDYNSGYPDYGYALYNYNPGDAVGRDGSAFEQVTTLVPGNSGWTLLTMRMDRTITCDGIPISPANMPMLADSLENQTELGSAGAWGYHMYGEFTTSDIPTAALYGNAWGGIIYAGEAAYSSAIQTVHAQVANVAFFDGHAESMTAKELRANLGIREECTYDQYGNQIITP